MNNFLFSPGTLTGKITLADGITEILPLAAAGAPRALPLESDCYLVLSLTPTSTSFTVAADASVEGGFTLTGATSRVASCQWSSDIAADKLKYLRVFARRKPGTSGAMVAQTVTFGGTSSGTIQEMGRINVLANSTTGEPDADFFDKAYVAGHANFTCDSTNPFKASITAVDTDLELVIVIFGQQP